MKKKQKSLITEIFVSSDYYINTEQNPLKLSFRYIIIRLAEYASIDFTSQCRFVLTFSLTFIPTCIQICFYNKMNLKDAKECKTKCASKGARDVTAA